MENINVLSVDRDNRYVELLVRSLTLTFRYNRDGKLFYNTKSESSSYDPEAMRLPKRTLAAAYKRAAAILATAPTAH
ncbi:MAG: hypothetical protein U9Q16_02890 [Patescibacteria group bacterium]|nr:hypothetical protein [Patescibacteria group bacterium]